MGLKKMLDCDWVRMHKFD